MDAYKKYLKKVSWEDVPFAPQHGLAPYQVLTPDGAQTGLFTGYFEPVLRGSFTKNPPFIHPVYAPPEDLVVIPNFENSGHAGQFLYGKKQDGKIIPHVTRGDVLRGALQGKNLELLYVDDAVDLFFAHIQGSAAIQINDKIGDRQSASLCERSPNKNIGAAFEQIIRIGFAAKSGHAYTAIGKTLKTLGALELPITMHAIKDWLRSNPERQDEIFASNASFIFFKILTGQGPIGASGEVLIPEESLAVDDTIWPYGLEVIVATYETTDNPLNQQKPFIRKMRTADTGSAIRGVLRGDIYFGSGDAAGAKAGSMNAQGKMWALLAS